MRSFESILPDDKKTVRNIDAFILPNVYGGLDCSNCNYYIPKLFNPRYCQFVFDEQYLKGYETYVHQGFMTAFRSYMEKETGSDILNNQIENSGFTSSIITIPGSQIDNISIKDIIIITKIGKSNLSEMIYYALKFAVSKGYSSVAIPYLSWMNYGQNIISEQIQQGVRDFSHGDQSDIQVYILLREELGSWTFAVG